MSLTAQKGIRYFLGDLTSAKRRSSDCQWVAISVFGDTKSLQILAYRT